MNIKDEHTSRLWNFIMKGEIMDLDDDELIATRVNNKTASWKEVEEYIEKNYVRKDIIKARIEKLKVFAEKADDETLNACELDIRKNQIYLLQSILQEGDK